MAFCGYLLSFTSARSRNIENPCRLIIEHTVPTLSLSLCHERKDSRTEDAEQRQHSFLSSPDSVPLVCVRGHLASAHESLECFYTIKIFSQYLPSQGPKSQVLQTFQTP